MTVTSKIRTPGPWKYVPSTPQEGFECYWIMGGSGQHRVDIGSVHGPQTPEREATARLIAAAPDLLNALKLVMQECDLDYVYSIKQTIQDAIVKAEGP